MLNEQITLISEDILKRPDFHTYSFSHFEQVTYGCVSKAPARLC